jgi:hypothetical protein
MTLCALGKPWHDLGLWKEPLPPNTHPQRERERERERERKRERERDRELTNKTGL